jgi:hypothetical protein
VTDDEPEVSPEAGRREPGPATGGVPIETLAGGEESTSA